MTKEDVWLTTQSLATFCLCISHFTNSGRSCREHNNIRSVVNSLFSVTASCGKTLIIFVIWGREILHVPSNLLLCCLAISDLVVGLISQPASSFYRHQRIWPSLQCRENVLFSCSGWLFSGLSLLTLCAISVDRYLALKLHLRYTAVVTVNRVLATVIGFWILCDTVISFSFVIRNNSHWNAIAIVLFFLPAFLPPCWHTLKFSRYFIGIDARFMTGWS